MTTYIKNTLVFTVTSRDGGRYNSLPQQADCPAEYLDETEYKRICDLVAEYLTLSASEVKRNGKISKTECKAAAYFIWCVLSVFAFAVACRWCSDRTATIFAGVMALSIGHGTLALLTHSFKTPKLCDPGRFSLMLHNSLVSTRHRVTAHYTDSDYTLEILPRRNG